MKYTATGYMFIDCPSCDGETEEAYILFGDQLEDILKWAYQYRIDRIYEDGKLKYRCGYSIGFHRISNIYVCNLDKFDEADIHNVAFKLGPEKLPGDKPKYEFHADGVKKV